jgi:signal transduction histidine kinase
MPATRSPEHILIVDDDEGMLILMAEALRAERYAVATAHSGSAALEAMVRQVPDLMLLDLKMQDMDGTALIKSMRERNLKVPFIVVTGRGDEKVAVETMKEGALDYVMKDTGLLDLLATVVKRALAGVGRDRALAEARAESLRLESEIVAISEKERHNIGADLHDGLGQQLTAIELICTGLKEDLAKARPDLGERVEQMGRMLRDAVSQTRVLSRGLVPVRDDPDALRTALAELTEGVGSPGRIRCRLECPPTVAPLEPAVAGHLYRIAQEAVNNAVKHSKTTEIVVRFRDTRDGPWLQVSDNGCGMAKTDAGHPGLGLRMMQHRARVIGATLTVSSKRAAGVTVTCSFAAKEP